ncbi:Carbon-nitrogen hydrolase [Mycoemilia scoparia]|uniref:Carbon-nitrogen hydrolase n=1 Tax=Mycoemilia scoparia TaxID=417184 RepID=A0A9W8A0Z9_9FUNG|nr:Carbon-nitrogen hydrolase [Mycoemilia scoparia]
MADIGNKHDLVNGDITSTMTVDEMMYSQVSSMASTVQHGMGQGDVHPVSTSDNHFSNGTSLPLSDKITNLATKHQKNIISYDPENDHSGLSLFNFSSDDQAHEVATDHHNSHSDSIEDGIIFSRSTTNPNNSNSSNNNNSGNSHQIGRKDDSDKADSNKAPGSASSAHGEMDDGNSGSILNHQINSSSKSPSDLHHDGSGDNSNSSSGGRDGEKRLKTSNNGTDQSGPNNIANSTNTKNQLESYTEVNNGMADVSTHNEIHTSQALAQVFSSVGLPKDAAPVRSMDDTSTGFPRVTRMHTDSVFGVATLAAASSNVSDISTPLRHRQSVSAGNTPTPGSSSTTPLKRPAAPSPASESNPRLKSKVWNWYDVLEDGHRQCLFCNQKYGPLTATTILARHYANKHDQSNARQRTSRRVSTSKSTTSVKSAGAISTSTAMLTAHNSATGSPGTQTPIHNSQHTPASFHAHANALLASGGSVTVPAPPHPPHFGQMVHANGLGGTVSTAGGIYGTHVIDTGVMANEDLIKSVTEAVNQHHNAHPHSQQGHQHHSHHSQFVNNNVMMASGLSFNMAAANAQVITPQMMSALSSRTPVSIGNGRVCASVAQFCATNNTATNLQTCIDLVAMASQSGSKMLFLPEASDFIAETPTQAAQLAQPLQGNFLARLRKAAKAAGVWVSLGVHESAGEGIMYNTNVVMNDRGELVSIYRKLHLFDVDIKNGPCLRESDTTTRGEDVMHPVQTPVGRLGLAICYDVRFPEMANRLRSYGAELLCYPSAFTERTGSAHWEVLLRARAIETQTYVFGAAQRGRHNSKRTSYGDAMIVDPWGAVLARCPMTDKPSIATADIDLEFLKKVRREMPVFEHRRTDLFGGAP